MNKPKLPKILLRKPKEVRDSIKQVKQDISIEKKYQKVDKKLDSAKKKGPAAYQKANKKYGYNYESALSAGLGPDSTGHWPSRNPQTGEILKGRKHPTFKLTKQGEKEAGYEMYKKDGKTYSRPKTTLGQKIKSVFKSK